MTQSKKLLAVGVFGLSGYLSVAVLMGQIPGANSEIAILGQVSDLIAADVETHGQILAALRIFVFGIVAAILCLMAPGDGSAHLDWGDSGGDGGD